jgi:hypothetical protein
MLFHLFVTTALLSQVQVQSQTTRDTSGRQTSVSITIGGTAADTFRRIPVTAQHLATAFRDAQSRSLLTGARVARLHQDSTLRSYDAKAHQRISVGMSLRSNGRQRLMVRDEAAARIQWDRRSGAVVDLLGKRTTVPVADEPEQIDEGVRRELALPIPYFPGRETLWIGASVTPVTVDERSFVHQIAEGAEAYYTYEAGDSATYTLPDGKKIRLLEMRIEARKPRWNLMVGSFWFDESTSQLVRAVYRPSIPMDIWEVASETADRDTNRKNNDDDVPWWVKGLVSPMKVTMEVFTIEYGLFEGRFWLPTSQGAEGKAQASFIHVPVVFEEKYVYESVNGDVDVEKPMSKAPAPRRPLSFVRDSLKKAGTDKAVTDSILAARYPYLSDTAAYNARQRAIRDSLNLARKQRRDSLAALGFRTSQIDSVLTAAARVRSDSLRAAREKACLDTGYTTHRTRAYQDHLDVLIRVPCDLKALARSPELPPSAYEAGEELFDRTRRDELLGALDFGLQAGWGPQKISIDFGFSQSRYNRVEGFSTAIGARQELGMGYAWNALLRGSQGDRQLNGEIGVERSNGRTILKLNAYRRLAAANDWGSPLTFMSSIPALTIGRDEGVYYRAWGAELLRTSERGKKIDWRLFAEQEWKADVTTRFSLFHGTHDTRFGPNVLASRDNFVGGGVRWRQDWGLAPRGWRTFADLRLEGAGGTKEYGRGALDLSVSHGLFTSMAFSLAGGAGTSVGDLPAQRNFFLGGTSTVRGQALVVDTLHMGTAFWYGRAELARSRNANRLSVFGDLGWAGNRDGDWGRSRRLLSGVGIGSSVLEGLLRTDLSRGLWPRKGWRFDFSVEAPF